MKAWLAVFAARRCGIGLLALFAAVFLAACVSAPIGQGGLLDFIQDGQTTKEDVLLRLGEPNALYEDARILTYRLSQDEKGWILLGPTKGWSEAFVNLVLVFDSQGVLRRHSQVKVRSP